MDIATVDQQYNQLQQEARGVSQTLQILAGKLKAAAGELAVGLSADVGLWPAAATGRRFPIGVPELRILVCHRHGREFWDQG